MNLDEYMTEKELAAVLRQPLMKIQEWRRIGFMPPHVRLAFKTTLYRKADVATWLESKRVEPVRREQEAAPERAARAA